MIVNACFSTYAAVNIAEHFTQPVDYFDFGDDVRKVPFEAAPDVYLRDRASLVLVGGGGIAGWAAWKRLRDIVERTPRRTPIAIWGMGINDPGRLDRNYDATLAYLEQQPNVVIGLRDCFYRTYVPCVSCMRPEFDCSVPLEHEVVFYRHHGVSGLSFPCPTMSNRLDDEPARNFARVIRFLASAEIVITNTYHGAYWATLLKKHVVIVAPFSNKFMSFTPEPVIVADASQLLPLLDDRRRLREALARVPPAPADAVQISRAANDAFFRTVVAFARTLA